MSARRNLTLATAAFLLCFSAWGMLAPLAPKLEDNLDLSNTQTSVMIAVPVLLGSLLRIPMGVFTDRFGGRKVFTAMLLYCAFPPLLVGFADSYAMLLVAGFLLGVSGAAFAVGVPFVSEWYPPERQGQALGLYGIGTAGTAISAWTMPAIYDGYSQETAGIIYSLVLLAFAGVWVLSARNAPDHEPKRTPYGRVLRSGWRLWQLSLFYFVAFGGFVAMSLYLPKLLTDWFDYSKTSAGARAAGFVIVAALIARPLGGRWSDRWGGERVLSVAFFGVGLDAIGLSWQASDPSIVPVTIFCLSMTFFLGMGAGAVFKLVPTLFPDTKGAVTGIVGAAGGLGGFFPPLLMGVVKDATGEYVMGFVFLVAFAWMCAGQALATRTGGPAGSAARLLPDGSLPVMATITQVHGVDGLRALIGQTIGPSDWREVTQEMITSFAEISGDDQWIHVDEERAKTESPFGTTIAHGNLTLSMIDGFRKSLMESTGFKLGVNYGWNKVRFPAPVPTGSRLRATAEVVSVDDVGGGWVQVVTKFVVEAEGGEKPVCVAESVGRALPEE